MRGCVDLREKAVNVPGLSEYPSEVALPLSPSPSQSAVGQYGWGSTPCGAVSIREVIVIVPAFLEL